jgi:branched-chain amino acid transport system permease protein
MRLLNVAHGEFVMLGAYAAYWIFTLTGLQPLAALPAVAIVTGALGLAAYLGLFRGLLRKLWRRVSIQLAAAVLRPDRAAERHRGALTPTPRGYSYLDAIVTIGHSHGERPAAAF